MSKKAADGHRREYEDSETQTLDQTYATAAHTKSFGYIIFFRSKLFKVRQSCEE